MRVVRPRSTARRLVPPDGQRRSLWLDEAGVQTGRSPHRFADHQRAQGPQDVISRLALAVREVEAAVGGTA